MTASLNNQIKMTIMLSKQCNPEPSDAHTCAKVRAPPKRGAGIPSWVLVRLFRWLLAASARGTGRGSRSAARRANR